jgi:hypothetical protein
MSELPPSPEQWLKGEDEANFSARVDNLHWLVEQYPRIAFAIFPGGIVTKYLFENARYCFVYEQYLATIILSLSFIEHSIAGWLYSLPNHILDGIGVSQKKLVRATIRQLINYAVALNRLSNEDAQFIDELRQIRNPLVHQKPLSPVREEGDIHPDDWWKQRIEERSLKEGRQIEAIIEEDARRALVISFRILELNETRF